MFLVFFSCVFLALRRYPLFCFVWFGSSVGGCLGASGASGVEFLA